jgi:hypothetical protein
MAPPRSPFDPVFLGRFNLKGLFMSDDSVLRLSQIAHQAAHLAGAIDPPLIASMILRSNSDHRDFKTATASLKKEQPGLFKPDAVSAADTPDPIDLRKLTPDEYRALRSTNPEVLGLRPRRKR